MRIVAISDTHTLHDKMYHPLPEGDMLVHAGDFCSTGREREVRKFSHWLLGLDYKYKVLIAGNHETWLERLPWQEIRDLFPGITYLHGEAVVIEGIKFWGGPWTPRFCDWAFNVDRSNLKGYWDNIDDDTQVLITHGPPYGVLDSTSDYYQPGKGKTIHVGCSALANRIKKLKSLQVHIFGHIHTSYGIEVSKDKKVLYANAAICNDRYEPEHKPLTINI